MPGFASLQPAYTAQLTFAAPRVIGDIADGGTTYVAAISGGTFISEAGHDTPLDAVFDFGADHFVVESDFQTVRIDVKACLKDKDESIISYQYAGTIEVDESFKLILTGSPEAKTTNFGKIFTHVTLKSGAERLKSLQRSKFVGSSRFIINSDGQSVIESKISKIVYAE